MTDPASSAVGSGETVLCVDVGSTYTKALLVDLGTASVVGASQRPTFGSGDVLDAVGACRAEIAAVDGRASDAEILACSSAGGGLRVAVVGHEALVTAEAGRRVALSSGAKVVGVIATAAVGHDVGARLLAELVAPQPPASGVDLVLLTGGTDGGNRAALVDAARAVAGSGFDGPVVVAGNVDAHDEVAEVLAGVPHVLAGNAVPRIGVLAPESARAAVRAQFLQHVIAGKGLTARGDELARLVQGPTPDVVLAGVEMLALGIDDERPGIGDVAVVDIGGATTDVYSVVTLDAERSDDGLAHEVVAPTVANRTVEADLGMRESAGLPGSFVPTTDEEYAADEEIARSAAATAVRRHAGRSRVVLSPDGRVVERSGVDLREVALIVGSGGVLRHGRPGVAERVLGGLVTADDPEGWQLPERARIVVDQQYLLMGVGLLADRHSDVAYRLAMSLTTDRSRVAP
ncbi:glutamate mutase L [Nocardioides bizhenqiangii]|uniref:Glutamate mutase L n=1 Tax=Nocardioides bizhenqiangii TaxID=3095076 RepID=A0ABZ0ZT80_9ACTN|nr:glutamate mutase L [Nocardioides sp. HM61]WQQ27535.1 glutamate mutase L [Nocardioides sp. HM61]